MQKSKLTTIGIILVTIVLAGVAIFTAVRLYQTRATKVTPNDSQAYDCPAGQVEVFNYNSNNNRIPPYCGIAQTPNPTMPGCTSNITCSTQCGLPARDADDGCGGTKHCDATPACSVPTPTATSNSCLPKAYFDIVLTDANGDNAGTCRPTSITFGSNDLSCNNTGNITCDQYLAQLTQQSGVNKTGGCYDTVTACQNPDGKAASFRFFYNGSKCVSTNHRYWTSGTGANNDIDADDPNNRTCVTNLTLAGVAKKVCYTTKSACQTDNTLPTPTATSRTNPTPTATPVDLPNTCLLEFTINTVATPTPTATSVVTATPTATATSTSVATVTPTPTATSVAQCSKSCTNNADCSSGLMCYITSGNTTGMCRNTQCLSESDCTCNTATATATSTNVVYNPTTTPEQPELPDAGTTWPTILGTVFGVVVLLGSLLLAL